MRLDQKVTEKSFRVEIGHCSALLLTVVRDKGVMPPSRAGRRKSAWDKPQVNEQWLAGMRAAGAEKAALSERDKSDRETAILNRVRTSSKLSTEAGKRFLADTRGALRRVKDGAGATPCSDYSRRGCTKCKTGRVGDAHHIFCERRDTFKHQHEKELALELKREIEKLHRDWWAEGAPHASADTIGAPHASADTIGVPLGASVDSGSGSAPSSDPDDAADALLPGPAAALAGVVEAAPQPPEAPPVSRSGTRPPSPALTPLPPPTSTALALVGASSSPALTPAAACMAEACEARVEAGRRKAAEAHASDKSALCGDMPSRSW